MSIFYVCYNAWEPHSTNSEPLTFTDTETLFCLMWIELALKKKKFNEFMFQMHFAFQMWFLTRL